MIFELLSTLSAGLCAAGLVYLVFKTVQRKPPRFLVPMAAGVSMILLNAYLEYSWFDRSKDALGDKVVILQEVRDRSILRPWSFLYASVNRFKAMDGRMVHRNPADKSLVMTSVLLRQRYFDPVSITVVVNCETGMQADLTRDVHFDDKGLPVDANWYKIDTTDRLYATVCHV